MTAMPMFPLGSVLFPHMPVLLRVFEERYLVMLARILESSPAEFGVVLIERGQEVGGGEHRFAHGTVAQITQLEVADGFVGLVARGDRRIEVTEWMEEDLYPRAVVHVLPSLEWTDALHPLKDQAEKTVRRAIARSSEFQDSIWSADIELSNDPAVASWQIAGIAPIGPLDQVALLRSTSMEQLLTSVIAFTTDAEETFRASWPDG